MAGDTQPTLPLPDAPGPVPAPRPRRRGRRVVIGLAVAVVLLVAAVAAGEWLARDLVHTAVRERAVAALGAPADTEIDVDVPGSLLLQLATGTIGEATVSSPDLRTDRLSGAVSVTFHDLALRDGPASAGGTATVSLDAAQLRALASTVDGVPADTLGLAAPDVTASVELGLFGVSTTFGLALTPSAADGDLVLTPSAVTLGDAELTAEQVRDRFGRLADPLVRGWHVCIADSLPALLVLSGVDVVGDRLEARFDIAPGPLTEEALAAKGTCG